MQSLNVIRVGAAVAAFAAVWHLAWAVLVAAGWAQPLLDFVFRLHFLQPAWQVQPFDLATAALLVMVTAAAGFAVGAVLAAAWNSLPARR